MQPRKPGTETTPSLSVPCPQYLGPLGPKFPAPQLVLSLVFPSRGRVLVPWHWGKREGRQSCYGTSTRARKLEEEEAAERGNSDWQGEINECFGHAPLIPLPCSHLSASLFPQEWTRGGRNDKRRGSNYAVIPPFQDLLREGGPESVSQGLWNALAAHLAVGPVQLRGRHKETGEGEPSVN